MLKAVQWSVNIIVIIIIIIIIIMMMMMMMMMMIIIIIVVVVFVAYDNYYWVYLSSEHPSLVNKVQQVLLHSEKGVTKCDRYTKCDNYYKVRQKRPEVRFSCERGRSILKLR